MSALIELADAIELEAWDALERIRGLGATCEACGRRGDHRDVATSLARALRSNA